MGRPRSTSETIFNLPSSSIHQHQPTRNQRYVNTYSLDWHWTNRDAFSRSTSSPSGKYISLAFQSTGSSATVNSYYRRLPRQTQASVLGRQSSSTSFPRVTSKFGYTAVWNADRKTWDAVSIKHVVHLDVERQLSLNPKNVPVFTALRADRGREDVDMESSMGFIHYIPSPES